MRKNIPTNIYKLYMLHNIELSLKFRKITCYCWSCYELGTQLSQGLETEHEWSSQFSTRTFKSTTIYLSIGIIWYYSHSTQSLWSNHIKSWYIGPPAQHARSPWGSPWVCVYGVPGSGRVGPWWPSGADCRCSRCGRRRSHWHSGSNLAQLLS